MAKRCPHRNEETGEVWIHPYKYLKGTYRYICGVCLLLGPEADSDTEAICGFWTKVFSKQEIPVALTKEPFYIVVSDEGPSDKPKHHSTKAEAEKEAERLNKLKPGITFTVFLSLSSVKTPKAEPERTTFEVPYYYPFNNRRWY